MDINLILGKEQSELADRFSKKPIFKRFFIEKILLCELKVETPILNGIYYIALRPMVLKEILEKEQSEIKSGQQCHCQLAEKKRLH